MKKKPTALRNTYFAQRHGDAFGNERGIIVSDPALGRSKEFGLTETGRNRVETSALHYPFLGQKTVIVSSDFSRARQSAELTQGIIRAESIRISPKLRERYFGIHEGAAHTNYQRIWDDDRINPRHRNHGGESADDVLERLLSLIFDELEYDYSGEEILLVSHGDPLQILQCWFEGIDPRCHRDIKHLETAEIRRLFRTS